MLTVFAQQPRPSLDVGALEAYARRHLAATVDVLGAPAPPPFEVGARLRIVRAHGAHEPVERVCWGRAAREEDHDAAARAEARGGYTGLAQLARRCATVWVLETTAEDDRAALLVAALLAGVLLGPILVGQEAQLIGARTARARAEPVAR